jgi:hypothetical protein
LVAEPQRQPLLHRAGRHPVRAPQPAQLARGRVGRAVPGRDVGAVEFVLGNSVSGADAEVQPPVAEDVDDRGLLGDLDGAVQRRDQDAGADPHPLGARRRGGREGERLRQVVVVEEVVLGQPHRVAAEQLGLLAHLQREGVQPRRRGAPGRRVPEVEVEAHTHVSQATGCPRKHLP